MLFVLPRFHTNLFFATRAMAGAGMRVSVFANKASGGEDHSIVSPLVFGQRAEDQQLANALDQAAPDLILLRDSQELSAQVAKLAQHRGIPIVAYNLKPLTQRRSLRDRFRCRLQGLPLERVTPVRGLDPSRASDPRAHYLPWPVERDPDVEPQHVRDSRVRILCVGKLMQPRKNQHLLIQALRDAGLTDCVQLTLVGASGSGARGTEQQHLDALEEASKEDWITLLRDHPFKKMGELYAAADICVLPALREPLGHAPTEAMAYGAVPVISTDCGSAGYIDHEQNGLRIDLQKPGDLKAKLKQLVLNSEMRARIASNAEVTAKTELGPDLFLERMSRLIALKKEN